MCYFFTFQCGAAIPVRRRRLPAFFAVVVIGDTSISKFYVILSDVIVYFSDSSLAEDYKAPCPKTGNFQRTAFSGSTLTKALCPILMIVSFCLIPKIS